MHESDKNSSTELMIASISDSLSIVLCYSFRFDRLQRYLSLLVYDV